MESSTILQREVDSLRQLVRGLRSEKQSLMQSLEDSSEKQKRLKRLLANQNEEFSLSNLNVKKKVEEDMQELRETAIQAERLLTQAQEEIRRLRVGKEESERKIGELQKRFVLEREQWQAERAKALNAKQQEIEALRDEMVVFKRSMRKEESERINDKILLKKTVDLEVGKMVMAQKLEEDLRKQLEEKEREIGDVKQQMTSTIAKYQQSDRNLQAMLAFLHELFGISGSMDQVCQYVETHLPLAMGGADPSSVIQVSIISSNQLMTIRSNPNCSLCATAMETVVVSGTEKERKALACFPILKNNNNNNINSNDKVYGVLQVWRDGPVPCVFTTWEIHLLDCVARCLSNYVSFLVMLERQQAEAQGIIEQMQQKQQGILNKITVLSAKPMTSDQSSQMITPESLGLDHVLQTLKVLIQKISFGLSVAEVAEGGVQALKSYVEKYMTSQGSCFFLEVDSKKNLLGNRYPITLGLSGFAVSNRQMVFGTNAAEDSRFNSSVDGAGEWNSGAFVFVPVGDNLGLLQIVLKKVHNWSSLDLMYFETIARIMEMRMRTAIAVENIVSVPTTTAATTGPSQRTTDMLNERYRDIKERWEKTNKALQQEIAATEEEKVWKIQWMMAAKKTRHLHAETLDELQDIVATKLSGVLHCNKTRLVAIDWRNRRLLLQHHTSYRSLPSVESGIIGWVATSGEAVITDRPTSHPGFDVLVDGTDMVGNGMILSSSYSYTYSPDGNAVAMNVPRGIAVYPIRPPGSTVVIAVLVCIGTTVEDSSSDIIGDMRTVVCQHLGAALVVAKSNSYEVEEVKFDAYAADVPSTREQKIMPKSSNYHPKRTYAFPSK